MTRSVKKAIVLGHLGKDVHTKFSPNGVALTKFSVATQSALEGGQSDERKEETDWHNVVLWRSENLANYLTNLAGGRRDCADSSIPIIAAIPNSASSQANRCLEEAVAVVSASIYQ